MLKESLVLWCIVLSSVMDWGEVGLAVCLSGGRSLVLRRFHMVTSKTTMIFRMMLQENLNRGCKLALAEKRQSAGAKMCTDYVRD